MHTRKIGPFEVSAVSLGCMTLSHAMYGPTPDEAHGIRLLNEALDMGYSMLDTAALYGFGKNEELVGKAVGHRRDEFVLASKCGMFRNEAGVREINGRPEVVKKTCEDSLQRLGTEVIDLYTLHRKDPNVPIEDSVGALAELVAEGKVREIGLSEVSADTLRRAHAVHPIAALQSEYSLWTRNPEIAVLETCRELGVALVAYSPLARQYLTGALRDTSALAQNDLRRQMPRFDEDHYPANLALLDDFGAIAERVGCSMAQLALAWVLAQGEDVIPIPGTTSFEHLAENFAAEQVQLDAATLDDLDALINQRSVQGERYNPNTMAEIDSERFDG
jgi:hypothetical protein